MDVVKKNPVIPILEAARLSGLKYDMVVYLGRNEIVTPSGNLGGRGRRRLYTFSDVIFLRVIADLLRRGIEVKRLKAALKRTRAETAIWVDIRRDPRRYLVTDGIDLYVRAKGRLESKTWNRQLTFAFVLDLGAVHKEIADAWPWDYQAPARKRRSPSK